MQRKEEVKIGGAAVSLPVDLSCLQGGGGADREAALTTLEKQLICPICLELYNKPVVILPCQHNLCRKCANELYQPSLFQARTTMLVNSGRFRCPSCRHEVVLDRHGVYGLQRNLLVENIIDVYKQEVSNNNNAASLLPPPPPPAQLTCSDHEGEKVNIYCLTCQVPTCSLCKVFGAHQSCQVAPLSDVYQQQKDEVSEGVSSLLAVNDKIQAFIDELEETCRNIEENCKTQKQSVCDKFGRMFSILEERHKAMTQRISSEEDEKTGHAQALVRCYGDRVEANSKLMERAASSMEEPDMAAFVQNSRELITKVIAATGSCPTETLKPGYENMSHYRFNFSRQERVLRSIDFIKAAEDVPEEPEVEPEPEEPKEASVQYAEPKHDRETSTQNPESVAEPVKETIPAPMSTPAPTPPAPGLVRDSAGADLQPWTHDADLNDDRGSGQTKNKKEEGKREGGGCVAPDSVKEARVCEEGMSTQQCEGGEAGSDAGEWTAQRETEERRDAPGEAEDVQVEEGTGGVFYPSWYKPGSRRRVSPAPDPDPRMSSAGGSQTEARRADQIQPQPPGSQGSRLLSETQTHPRPYFPHGSENQSQNLPPLPLAVDLGGAFMPAPQVQAERQTAGQAGVVEEEDEDMQGWVCLPAETVDKSFSPAEGSFDLGDDSNDATLPAPPEETSSGVEKDDCELGDGRAEDAGENEQLEEDILGLNGASELKEEEEEEPGEGEAMGKGSVWSDERIEPLGDAFPGSETDAVAAREDGSGVKGDAQDVGGHGGGRLMRGDKDAEVEAGSSIPAETKRDDGESGGQPGDAKAAVERSAAETEENVTSCVSLQAVTLLFYLLAFLVILQRVWAYIGCFICT